jgi:hypothetical protein
VIFNAIGITAAGESDTNLIFLPEFKKKKFKLKFLIYFWYVLCVPCFFMYNVQTLLLKDDRFK